MRVTTFTDYCLRVLMYVGAKGETLSTIDEIAAGYGISRNHLMKVVARLAQLGYVTTIRGNKGGIRLARAPADINIGDVVRSTEEDLALVACFQPDGTNSCPIAGCCVLQQALSDALAAFLGALDGYTLASLLQPRARLAEALRIPAPVWSP